MDILSLAVEGMFLDQENRLLNGMRERKVAAEPITTDESYMPDAMSVSFTEVNRTLFAAHTVMRQTTEISEG